jgi:hypothetical protein
VLKITLETGTMKLGRVALDGTKIKANASKHKAMSYERMKQQEKAIGEQVKELLLGPKLSTRRKMQATGKTDAGMNFRKSYGDGRVGWSVSGRPRKR